MTVSSAPTLGGPDLSFRDYGLTEFNGSSVILSSTYEICIYTVERRLFGSIRGNDCYPKCWLSQVITKALRFKEKYLINVTYASRYYPTWERIAAHSHRFIETRRGTERIFRESPHKMFEDRWPQGRSIFREILRSLGNSRRPP